MKNEYLNEAVSIFVNCLSGNIIDKIESFHIITTSIHELLSAVRASELKGLKEEEIKKILGPAQKIFIQSPFIQRMQSWPRGYTGDFETIDYMLDGLNNAQPYSLGYFLEEFALSCPLVQQHRNKVLWQSMKVMECIEGNNSVPKILSIACGSSRDLSFAFKKFKVRKARIYLNDIDEDALKKSVSRLKESHIIPKIIPGNIFRKIRELQVEGLFDLIIVGGLFDYLQDKQVSWLLRQLKNLLSDVGSLCFTNIILGNMYRTIMTFIGNWKLHEREKEFFIEDLNYIIQKEDFQLYHTYDTTGLAHLMELKKNPANHCGEPKLITWPRFYVG